MARIATALVCLSVWIPLISSLEYIVSDISGLGRRFDGIGGLSGGGATSKLLVNYPEQQRNEILDYLFKPNYGASLHILKVEIGGDAQSTDGTESSHMHESWDENFGRGYEWWLLTEAKRRNPDILLYVLPWGFPGWVGQGTSSPYTAPNVTADYIVRFISGAKSVYGLTIDYVGIWNERPYDVTYVKTLRQTLDSRGLNHTQIVAPDGQWDIAKDILADSDFAKAVDFLGAHYPGTVTTYDALRTEKQLWASEDYSTYNDNTGAGCWARILNQNYVNGMMTATISWNLIASYYSNLPFYRDGLMTAIEPWGGHYVVEAPIWVSAHTTQFTKPGWRYLLHSSGVGKLQGGGSYVSFTDPGSSSSLTIVIETMSHNHSLCIRPALPKYSVVPQNVLFNLQGSFANVRTLNVWYSKLQFDGSSSTLFEKRAPIQVVNGQVVVSLGVDEMYTLTTATSGVKGTAPASPASLPFPLPYTDNFDSYPLNAEPDNLAQQIGVWEAVEVGPPHEGAIRQMVLQEPVKWCAADAAKRTLNVIGNPNWTDISIQSDVRIPSVNGSKGVFVAVRVSQGGCQSADAPGVFFVIYPDSQSYSLLNDLGGKHVIKTGSANINSDWNTISLLIRDNNIIGSLNGETAFSLVAPEKPMQGFVALGTDGYGLADFDNLVILSADEGWRRLPTQQRDADTLYFRPEGRL